MKSTTTKSPRRQNVERSSSSSGKRRRIRVVIVDENPLCRRGLRALLGGDERFDVVGEADNGEAGLKAILEQKPDVAVLDSDLPGIGGLEMAALLKVKDGGIHPVILAHAKDEQHLNRAINLGIKGYVLRQNAESEIVDCIAVVARGEAYICSMLTAFLLRRGRRTESLERREPGLSRLTDAERRVLNRIAQGKTSKEIAAEWNISPRTVDSHRSHICEKLNLSGKNRLLQFALEHRDAFRHLD